MSNKILIEPYESVVDHLKTVGRSLGADVSPLPCACACAR